MNFHREFSRYGKMLFQQGLISASAGNLSCRKRDKMYITASGSFLGELDYGEVVEVSLSGAREYLSFAQELRRPSVEAEVHKSIYLNTPRLAIAHGHAPYALALAASIDNIVFTDAEGQLHLPSLPVLELKDPIGSSEAAERLPKYFTSPGAVVIRNHGVFAAADTLKAAVSLLSTAEFSSKIICLAKDFKRD
ncbi:MAG: hypothetical protein GX817_00145 [Elusimicrobia bacterium]|nr:hypothetical protein [Elusimicrobiota bacterium]